MGSGERSVCGSRGLPPPRRECALQHLSGVVPILILAVAPCLRPRLQRRVLSPGSDGPVQRSRTLTLAPPYTLAPAVWAHCILPLFCSNDSCPRAQTIISLTCPDFLSAWCVVQAQEYMRLRTVHGSEEVYHSKWQSYSDTDFKRQYIKYNQELIK